MNIDNETRHALMASCDNLLFGDERMRLNLQKITAKKAYIKKATITWLFKER